MSPRRHPDRQAFRTYLLVHELQASETVAAHLRRLTFSLEEGFNLRRYVSSPTNALRAGEDYLAHRRTVAGPEAYRNDVKLLNLLARWAGHNGVKWRMPPEQRPDLPIYARPEVRRLLRVDLDDELESLQARAVAQFNLATGLRRGEVGRLTEPDVDLDVATYRIVSPSKRGPKRTLPFADARICDTNSPFRQWIEDRPRALKERQALWIHLRARTPCSVEDVGIKLWLAGRSCDVLASCQRGRRSFVTWMHEQGASLPLVQHFLGHSRIETTRHYLKLRPEHVRRELDEIQPRLPILAAAA